MAEKKSPKVYRPIQSFATQVDGKDVSYREDTDFIFEGDPILKKHPHLFAEFKPEAK